MGPGALCRAELRLTARAGDSEGPRFEDLPLLRWPAPRSLAPRERLTQTAQVDLAGLAAYLRCRPLEQVSVTIEGVFSPEGDSQTTHSAVPGVSVAPAEVTRRELLASFGVQEGPDYAKAYRRGLGYVVRDMRRGTTDERLRAARQIGSLLALVRDVELQRQKLRAEQYDVVTRPVLLSMTRAMLRSDLPAAQAEMLAALTHVPVTRWTVGVVLNAAADDPSALVRFRLAEFLGAAAPQFSSEALAELAKDTDPLVRRLARALRPQGKPASQK